MKRTGEEGGNTEPENERGKAWSEEGRDRSYFGGCRFFFFKNLDI